MVLGGKLSLLVSFSLPKFGMKISMTILGKTLILMQFPGALGSKVTAQHKRIIIFYLKKSIIGGSEL